MKKLIITLEYPPQIGGIASFVYNLSDHLQNDEFVVWAPVAKGDIPFDARHAWKVYRGRPYFLLFWPRWLKLLFQIIGIIKKEKIEELVVHHVLPVGYIAYILKKFKKIPYTIFFHGTDLELAFKNKKKKLIRVCGFADKIVVNSNFLKNKLLAALPNLDKNKIKIINPCPGDIFLHDAAPDIINKLKSTLGLNGKKVIISVGRMSDGKGFPQLIRILPEILKKIPNAICVLVGDGPKRPTLVGMTQKNYLQNAVRFLGNISYTELPMYYRVADLFVLLTHKDEKVGAEEGWGTAFLEAAAVGLPVIAGRVGGSEEAVDDGIGGLVVDTIDDGVVVKEITDLLGDKETTKVMGAAGRERVLREFTWDKQIGNL